MFFFRRRIKHNKKPVSLFQSPSQPPFIPPLSEHIATVKKTFNEKPDLVVQQFICKQTQGSAALVYLSSLTNQQSIYYNILTPLMFECNQYSQKPDPANSFSQLNATESWSEIESAILGGNSILFTEERKEAFIFSTPHLTRSAKINSQMEPLFGSTHHGLTK